ncbi:MAG: molybdate ABC transporter substrate-binding protein [Vicinamibacterales bacterium]
MALRLILVAVLTGATAVAGRAQAPPSAPLMVFAASDLGPPFAQIVPLFESQTPTHVTLVLGSTGMLAQQIRNGAPADVFFAANESFIKDLTAEKLTLPGTNALYARGRIATATLKSNGIRINNLADLADARIRRIAIANPQHAPYGLAAKQALQAAGLWTTLEPKLVFGENVQQAVQFVRSGSAEAGIVARSVVNTSDLEWKLVDDTLHTPLDQGASVMARTKQPAASRSFIAFVNGVQGRLVMRQFGFLLPAESL